VAVIARRIGRLLARREPGGDADATDPLAAESLALAGLASATVQGRLALDEQAARDAVTASSVGAVPCRGRVDWR
jgi:hypothetical protein